MTLGRFPAQMSLTPLPWVPNMHTHSQPGKGLAASEVAACGPSSGNISKRAVRLPEPVTHSQDKEKNQLPEFNGKVG